MWATGRMFIYECKCRIQWFSDFVIFNGLRMEDRRFPVICFINIMACFLQTENPLKDAI